MRIIFSRDRAAQLDLLLQSIERNMPPEETTVIWTASDEQFAAGYADVVSPQTNFVFQETGREFDAALRAALVTSKTVTFFCDDDVVFRPVPVLPSSLLRDGVLCVRMVVGQETRNGVLRGHPNPRKRRHPVRRPRQGPPRVLQTPEGFPCWRWEELEPENFGFVGGIDGDTYRSHEALDALDRIVGDPTWVETSMSLSFRRTGTLPLVVCFPNQCVVGNAVNRVSPSSGVGCGFVFPQSTAELNSKFLSGQRIDYDALDFGGITSCHHEILLQWK